MNILITGSHGYIGSNFISQYKSKYQFEKFSLLTQKLEDINFNGVDVVLHCAALVHQKVEQPYEKYHEINVEYPIKLAKLAKQNGVKQFIFISTIAVYGEETDGLPRFARNNKYTEKSECTPQAFYGKSKLEAEGQLLALNDEDFVVSIIRLPMVYGKDAPGNMGTLIKLVKKVSIIPLGEIYNKRSFVYIGNLCHLVDEVIGFQIEFGMTSGNIFLASDDEPLSTTRLIELIAKELDKKVYLIKIPFFESLLKLLKPSFHKRLYGTLEIDNSQTKERLNLKNPYSVEEGIKFMIHGESLICKCT